MLDLERFVPVSVRPRHAGDSRAVLAVILAGVAWLVAAVLLGLGIAGQASRATLAGALAAVVVSLFAAVAAAVLRRPTPATLPSPLSTDDALPERDPLTGLQRRGYFQERTEEEFQRAQRYGARFAVLLLDIDGLQTVNEACGPERGDAMLRSVGAALRSRVRAADLAARLGGGRFAVLLTEAGDAEALAAVHRIGEAAGDRGNPDVQAGTTCPLSLSYGLAVYEAETRSSGALLRAAERSLYAMKREKRRRARYLPP
jgi:diguanylate cyclase (GGDEF)-like protein